MPATIKSKLTLGLSFIFLIILLLSGVGAYYLHQLSGSAEATLRNNYRSVTYAQRLANALADLRDARLSTGPTVVTAADQARRTFKQYLTAEQQNITEPGEGVLADSLATSFRQYLGAAPATEATSLAYQQLRRQTARVAALNLRAIEKQSQRTRRIASRTIGMLGLLAALGMLATFSFIFSFPDYVTKPVDELTAGIRRLAAGNYTQRLTTQVSGEFADVTRAFNDMAQRLEGYETADGTPRIDSSGALDLVTIHRRPGMSAPLETGPSAEQQRLLQHLLEQTHQLQLTAQALLSHPAAPAA